MEKISYLDKNTKIKSLEGLVIKLGYDSNDVKASKEMIKRKIFNILALRKQLKLPTTEDPQLKKLVNWKGERKHVQDYS